MILVRATKLSEQTAQFGEDLARWSGRDVAFLLDGRHPVTVETARPKVLVTAKGCMDLGLHTPTEFPWLCGDYGLYLARQQFPDHQHYWMIEYDIRLAGGAPPAFFAEFDRRPEFDLLACEFGPAGETWWWRPHSSGLGVTTYRCLFGVIRISANALDRLLLGRRSQSNSSLRREMWPNDEGFVATSLMRQGLKCADFNDFGTNFYDSTTLSLTERRRGETFDPPATGLKIYHPVLFGEDFERGNDTAVTSTAPRAQRSLLTVWRGRAKRKLLALSTW